AAEVRLNLYDYTIAVNGAPWPQTYGGVWEPIFHPHTGAVIAPIRSGGKWQLAQDGQIIWDQKFVQLWHQMASPDGNALAAIVAPKFGRWTVAVDGRPWSVTFKDMVTDAVFSPDGKRVAAAAKNDGHWHIVVDGVVWQNAFDRVWQPVFSPTGEMIAAKIERNGKYSVAVNDRIWDQAVDVIWDPIFSPESDKMMLRTLKDGIYTRKILSVEEILH
ncbi:MAG: WD40 repeat domain-containing protein, partial [Desulfobacterales bacterium]